MPTMIPPTNRQYWDMYEQTVKPEMESRAQDFSDTKTVSQYEVVLEESMWEWATNLVKNTLNFSPSKGATAEEVLEKLMSALSETERKRFVLTNMLEALKKGDSLSSILKHYNAIGLTEINPMALQQPQRPIADDSQEKPAGHVWRLLKRVARLCEPMIKAVIMTLRQIAKGKIKIHPVIGMSGLLPTLAVQFDFDAEVGVAETWDFVSNLFAQPAQAAA